MKSLICTALFTFCCASFGEWHHLRSPNELDEAEQASFCAFVKETRCIEDCNIGCGICNTTCTSDNHIGEMFGEVALSSFRCLSEI